LLGIAVDRLIISRYKHYCIRCSHAPTANAVKKWFANKTCRFGFKWIFVQIL